MTSAPPSAAKPAKDYRVRRDGDVALVFKGVLLGEAETGGSGVSFISSIYRTPKGTWIAARKVYFNNWEGRDSDKAEKFTDPHKMVAWFRHYEDGKLPPDAQCALNKAAKCDERLGLALEERVD